MKRAIILILSLIILSTLTGCITKEVAPAVICNAPYMHFETGCCLDENNDLICDPDKIGETTEEETTTTSSGNAQELTADYVDFPDSPGRFDGRYIFFWEDGIELKLKYLKSGEVALRKIWFRQLDCGIEFSDDDKYRLEYWEDILLEIPCEMPKNIITINHLDLEFDYYEKKTSGVITKEPNPMKTSAEVGGAVRNRETNQPIDPSAENLVIDVCYFAAEQPYDCTQHWIGPDFIEIRLKVIDPGMFVWKKVEWPTVPCEYEFEDTSRDAALKLGDEKVFRIPCEIKREYVESYMELTIDEYAPKMAAGKIIEGEYEEEPKGKFIPYAWVSGMVKEE